MYWEVHCFGSTSRHILQFLLHICIFLKTNCPWQRLIPKCLLLLLKLRDINITSCLAKHDLTSVKTTGDNYQNFVTKQWNSQWKCLSTIPSTCVRKETCACIRMNYYNHKFLLVHFNRILFHLMLMFLIFFQIKVLSERWVWMDIVFTFRSCLQLHNSKYSFSKSHYEIIYNCILILTWRIKISGI